MKYLLDVNALLAAILAIHSRHQVADTWLRRKLLATCPLR
jgi:predicted nucleic acid-binding protein